MKNLKCSWYLCRSRNRVVSTPLPPDRYLLLGIRLCKAAILLGQLHCRPPLLCPPTQAAPPCLRQRRARLCRCLVGFPPGVQHSARPPGRQVDNHLAPVPQRLADCPPAAQQSERSSDGQVDTHLDLHLSGDSQRTFNVGLGDAVKAWTALRVPRYAEPVPSFQRSW